MDYTKRKVSCRVGNLTREDAAESLRQSRRYANAEILDIEKQGGKWVATILVPKTAGPPPFPPKDESEAPPEAGPEPEEEAPPTDDSSEGPPKEKPEGPPKDKGEKGGEKGELIEALGLLHQIAEALGIGGPPGIPGAEDGPMPGPGAPPPPGAAGPAPMPKGPGGPGSKLKPGEVPNRPGVVPIGAPAFASTNGGGDLDLSRVGSFDAFDDTPNKPIKQARQELEALYKPYGFEVRQIKRVENGTRLAAKLSRR